MEEFHVVWTAIIYVIGCWQLGRWTGILISCKLYPDAKCDKCGRWP